LSLLMAAVGWWWSGSPPQYTGIDYAQRVDDYRGVPLRLFTTDHGAWRFPVDLQALDPRLLEALLRIEDSRFYHHHGVDPLAVIRAVWQLLTQGRVVSGASTITMQLIRLLRPQPRTVANKMAEMAAALQLERQLPKEEILALYLTLTPYGGNLQGVVAACRFYFGKDPQRLTLSEIALLIALPQAPERRRPDRHPQQAEVGRRQVLQRLLEVGEISGEEYHLALKQPIPTERRPTPALAAQLTQRLQREADNGRKSALRSTIDSDLQLQAEQVAAFYQSTLPQGTTLAALVVANEDGALRAHLGSGGYWQVSQLDLTRAIRSPGSTLKPFIYALGFEQGLIHPQTRVVDRPQSYQGYTPQNFDKRYRGEVTVARALQQSLNIPAITLLQEVGPAALLGLLRRTGVELKLPTGDLPGLALGLGGAGVTLEQLATLYLAIPRNGISIPIKSSFGAVGEEGVRLISPRAAWYLDRILADTPPPPGQTGLAAVRFKTGTSYGFRDTWAVGYSRDYTVAVWVGRVNGGYGEGETGLSRAAPLLLRLFELLPGSEQRWSLPQPDGVISVEDRALPLALQHFPPRSGTEILPPEIGYPKEGSQLSMTKLDSTSGAVLLRVRNGTPPYAWLVNGEKLVVSGDTAVTPWYPDGVGAAAITVIDRQGVRDKVSLWVGP
ncbi:MAG: penicillin-binding protein 1C, partial [Gammaproteobacteria bacterium]|nr:penicillin-binding protein 1C [Gammaproteobacteria bacterium]